jgi:VCBS repeat-containing protein
MQNHKISLAGLLPMAEVVGGIKNVFHSGSYAFIGSYSWGTLSQTVDLVGNGYTEAYLDAAPTIDIGTFVLGYYDPLDANANATTQVLDPYQVVVRLLDTNHNLITQYDTGVQTATGSWQSISHTFSGYGSGVRYIEFSQKSRDAEFWGGRYGAIFDDASISLSAPPTNNPPTAADSTLSTNEDTDLVLTAGHFNFSDVDGNALISVKITDLATSGTLKYSADGTVWTDVTANQVITKIDIDAGKFKFVPAPNANGTPYATFSFEVNDGMDYSVVPNTITVNVAAVNDPPVITSSGTGTVAENAAISTVIYTAVATDVDASDTRIYSLKAATGDVALLAINATTGAVTLNNPADFETKASYAFTVIATDAGGLSAEKAVTVSVTNVNEAPVITSSDTGTVAENAAISTVIYTVVATDVDASDTRIYSLKAATGDVALLAINATTGEVTLNSSADFETKTSYTFTVIATDAGGLSAEKAVTVSVTNVNEAPVITSSDTGTVAENAAISTVIYTVVATDVDASDTRIYSLKAATGDVALLAINATTGEVTLNNPADFETKASYAFTVIATDAGGLSAEKAVTVSVTNVNEAPVITSSDTGTVIVVPIVQTKNSLI